MSYSFFVIPVTLVVCVLGLSVVVALYLNARGQRKRKTSATARVLDMDCTVCHKTLVIDRATLTVPTPTEQALVVSARPSVRGRALGEYRCPYCDSSHYFLTGGPLKWVLANAYEPQTITNNCRECQTPFKKPGWAMGMYDGEIDRAPDALPAHGLVCSRCDAVSCMSCCQSFTRNRTTDGSLLCPRCGRGPVNRFHHF